MNGGAKQTALPTRSLHFSKEPQFTKVVINREVIKYVRNQCVLGQKENAKQDTGDEECVVRDSGNFLLQTTGTIKVLPRGWIKSAVSSTP